MKKLFKVVSGIGMLISLTAGVASASLVTSLTGGVVVPMPSINYTGLGPETVAPGIVWSSTSVWSLYGFSPEYRFGRNGAWTAGQFVMAGLNTSSTEDGFVSSMTFAFNNAVSGVGGLLNYYPGYSELPVIAIYDSAHTLLESSTLSFSTGGVYNTGLFYGFTRKKNDIAYFTLSDAYVGITNLTETSAAPVPEPATCALLSVGLCAFAFFRKKT